MPARTARALPVKRWTPESLPTVGETFGSRLLGVASYENAFRSTCTYNGPKVANLNLPSDGRKASEDTRAVRQRWQAKAAPPARGAGSAGCKHSSSLTTTSHAHGDTLSPSSKYLASVSTFGYKVGFTGLTTLPQRSTGL